MELFKKYLIGMVLILVVAIVWGALIFVEKKVFVTLNPNASSYTKPIRPTFDDETLDEVSKRTNDSFPVLPREFLNLKDD